MICAKCSRRIKEKSEDPDFCKQCFNEIEEMTNNPMKHAEAAVAYINAAHPYAAKNREEVQMYAFLSIFHPKMPDRRKAELARSVGEK